MNARFDPVRHRLSRRGLLMGGAAAMGGLMLSGCSGGGSAKMKEAEVVSKAVVDGDLNLFSYADYFSPDVLAGFEEHYGVTINYTYFSTVDESIAKLSSGQPIDIVTLSSERMHALARSGLLKRVDHDAIEHYGEVLPEFVVPPYNGADEQANTETAPFVAAPYATGSVGTAWRNDKVQGMTGAFDDFWTHPEAAGHLFLWDSAQTTLSSVLRRLGLDPSTAGQEEMDRVVEAIDELRPVLGGFSGVDTTQIENGQAWLTPVYAGDLFSALNEMQDDARARWSFQTNRESALFNADSYAISAASQHSGTALCFVDWMLQPENMRTNVEYVGYPIPTKTGMAVYEELTRDYEWLRVDPAIFGQPEQWLTPIPEDRNRLWQQTWNLVKAG